MGYPRRRAAFIRTGNISPRIVMPMGGDMGDFNMPWSHYNGRRRLSVVKPIYSTGPPKIPKRSKYGAPKKTKGEKLSHVGDPINPIDTIKRYEILDNPITTYDTRELYTRNLLKLKRNATTQNAIDLRNRDIVNCSGVKFAIEYHSETSQPIYLRLFVVSRKNGNTAPDTPGFFRGTGDKRGLDFSNTLDTLDFVTRGINTDLYEVHWSQRRTLMPNFAGSGFETNYGSSYGLIEQYIPLNRQLRFSNDTDETPENGNLFLIWFTEIMFQPTGTLPSTVMKMGYRSTIFFRDV